MESFYCEGSHRKLYVFVTKVSVDSYSSTKNICLQNTAIKAFSLSDIKTLLPVTAYPPISYDCSFKSGNQLTSAEIQTNKWVDVRCVYLLFHTDPHWASAQKAWCCTGTLFWWRNKHTHEKNRERDELKTAVSCWNLLQVSNIQANRNLIRALKGSQQKLFIFFSFFLFF